MNTLLWLDDYRNPMEFVGVHAINTTNIVWVKSYAEFTEWIRLNGLPTAINFDHDLADITETEKTGYDCAKWLVEYCMDNNLKLPIWYTHSANPVGRDNINYYLLNFKKTYE